MSPYRKAHTTIKHPTTTLFVRWCIKHLVRWLGPVILEQQNLLEEEEEFEEDENAALIKKNLALARRYRESAKKLRASAIDHECDGYTSLYENDCKNADRLDRKAAKLEKDNK